VAQLSATQELARNEAPASLVEAHAYCRALARRHYENFTVASWLLPRRLVPHFQAIYAFCRLADDLADELPDAGASLVALDHWQAQLDRCYAGAAEHPVFVALGETIEMFAIQREPFVRLLEAFRQDQRVTRCATHAEVLAYCRNSANPVGELVLYLGRCHDERLVRLSDSVCTGLQLANFFQDVARDWAKGRVYLPQETLDRAGFGEDDFRRGQFTPSFGRALAVEVDRAESYLRAGEPLAALVPPELRVDVALFIAGGLSTLAAIRRAGYDVWSTRPTVSRRRQLALLVNCWFRFGLRGA